MQHRTVQRDRQHLRDGDRPGHLPERRGERRRQRPVDEWVHGGRVLGRFELQPTVGGPASCYLQRGDWTLAFPSSNFPADGSYIVRVYGTDNDGNVQSAGHRGCVQHRQHGPDDGGTRCDCERPVRLEPDVLRQRAGDAHRSRNRLRVGRRVGVVLLLRRLERQLHEQHAVDLHRHLDDVERQLRSHMEHTAAC